MPLQQLVRDEPFRCVSLCIHKAHMVIHVADALQLIRVPMVMRTPVDADQEDRHVRPGQAKEVKLELVHIGGLTVQEEE